MLNLMTLAFNAMPFLEWHLPIFEKLSIDWHWTVVHGPANNGGSTAWCKPQSSGLSTDGTTEYLKSIKDHPNVTVIERELWESKDEMCNAALPKEACVLLQCDSDEIHTTENLERICRLFQERPNLGAIMLRCRYYLGPDLLTVGEHCYGDNDYEWLRVFRYAVGQTWISHEPPKLSGQQGAVMSKDESSRIGLTFDHYAYATEAQAAFKERFYGYKNSAEQWRKLQQNTHWPVELKRFFPWVDDRVIVNRISA